MAEPDSKLLQDPDKEDVEVECRICFSSDEPETLCMPCSCTAPVHLECLERWCAEKGSPRCEICHSPYTLDEPKQKRVDDAIASHMSRQRARPRSALELLIGGDIRNGNDLGRFLQNLRQMQREQFVNQDELDEFDEDFEQTRQMQTRRLLVFAVMVVLLIIFFHILATVLLSGASPSTQHTNSSMSSVHLNSTSTHSNSTLGHVTHANKGQESPMNRLFRMLLFFYIIRMLFSRPPPHDRRHAWG